MNKTYFCLHFLFHRLEYYVSQKCNRNVIDLLKWVSLDILQIWWFWIYQSFEYASVLNMSGFWIYKGFKFPSILNIPGIHRPLNVSEYPWIIPGNAWSCLNTPQFWTLIQPYYDLPYLEIVSRRIYIIFVKHSIADVWQDCEYGSGFKYSSFLNMPGFLIYQYFENIEVLHMA